MKIYRIYFRALATLCGLETVRIFRIWLQTLTPPIVTVVLYFLVFGNFIGGRIGEIAGYDYVEFMAPGLVMMSVVTNSYANVSSSLFSKRFQKSVEEILVAPVPNWVMLLGFASGGVVRSVLVGMLVIGVSLFFTEINLVHPWLTLLVILLASFLFAFAGFLNGLYARNFDDVTVVPTFVLNPLIYLGGVFYSIEILPEFWRNLSFANPLLYVINALRYSMLGITDVEVGSAITLLVVFNLVLIVVCLALLRKGTGIRD